jgi:putative PEP-CTERM system histidine kinase
VSWRRSSGRAVLAISQKLVFSSITLVAVGAYLIVSSLLARWLNQFGDNRVHTEALVFLLCAVVLGGFLMWTSFRQRVRKWLRRHVFSGRYDYRHYWLEATERVRSTDAVENSAQALAAITHEALGAIDISVWLRRRNPNRLLLLASLGAVGAGADSDTGTLVLDLLPLEGPLARSDIPPEKKTVAAFMLDTRADLLVPLSSSDRLVGVLTVGSDRSGSSYGSEAREFLRVLAAHAAGEFHKYDLLAMVMEAKEMEAFRTFSTFLLHDLKNFASTLSLISSNAAKHRDNPEFTKDAFESVHNTAEKMKRLCNSLKTFSGTMVSNRIRQDLNRLIGDNSNTLRGSLGDAVRFDLRDIPSVLIDPDEIVRVLHNLVLNACESLNDGGRVSIQTRSFDSKVELAVTDTGRGIERKFLENELFHPFRTTKSSGLGIGLFQCKRIVEAHGGSIQVESQVGKGTTVRILLPAT